MKQFMQSESCDLNTKVLGLESTGVPLIMFLVSRQRSWLQGCSLGLDVSVSRRSFQTSRSRLGLVETREGLGLDLVSNWKSNVSVSYHRVSFTSQYAQLFAPLQNCTYIVLNARRLYCLLIHKLMSCLHPCCIHLQLQCSTHYSKSPFPWLC